jgi:hypothetical protein
MYVYIYIAAFSWFIESEKKNDCVYTDISREENELCLFTIWKMKKKKI